MQSDEHIAKDEVSTPTFHWTKEPQATKADQEAFWKALRKFYRTGKKPKNAMKKELTSVFHPILAEQAVPYPYLKEKPLTFGPKLPYQLLDYQLTHLQSDVKRIFKSKLQELMVGLNKLLSNPDSNDHTEDVFGFANEIIAFDKLSALIPKQKGTAFSEERKGHLKDVLVNLNKGLKAYDAREATFLVIEKNAFDAECFEKIKVLELNETEAIVEAEMLLKNQMNSFTSIIRAFRIAMLEVDNEYQPEIHDEFFDHFTWHRLTDEEKSLFLPVFLVVDHTQLQGQLDRLSGLLSTNIPIKVLVLNHSHVSEPDLDVSWEDASHRFRQELSTFAFSHRNVYTFQSAMDDPEVLYDGLEKGLCSNNPAIFHFLMPEGGKSTDWLRAKAASLGRYFPMILFDPSTTRAKEGNRFNIRANYGVGEDWYVKQINISDGKSTQEAVACTYADYKAFFKQKADELLIIPSAHFTDYLVPLSEYLKLKADELYGKIPFIWLTDSERNVYRAAVPNVWVVSCQERLDFWNFLQEIAGGPLLKQSEENGDALKVSYEAELAKVREEATVQAAERLIHELLSDENDQ